MRLQKTCNHLGREVSPIPLPVLPPLFDSLGNFGCICRLEIGLSVLDVVLCQMVKMINV